MENLLAHGRLKLSERNRRFLRFVVAETLAGRSDRIKAYTIGADVFGRGANFDPCRDPIVRIEATRIRSALSAYYEQFGAGEGVRIALPPGSYAPAFAFEENEGAAPAANGGSIGECLTSTTTRFRPVIVVTMRSDGGGRVLPALFELVKQLVSARLLAMNLRVFVAPPSANEFANRALEQLTLGASPVYRLDGVLYALDEVLLQSWSLIDIGSGELLSATTETWRDSAKIEVDTIYAGVDKVNGLVELALGEERRWIC